MKVELEKNVVILKRDGLPFSPLGDASSISRTMERSRQPRFDRIVLLLFVLTILARSIRGASIGHLDGVDELELQSPNLAKRWQPFTQVNTIECNRAGLPRANDPKWPRGWTRSHYFRYGNLRDLCAATTQSYTMGCFCFEGQLRPACAAEFAVGELFQRRTLKEYCRVNCDCPVRTSSSARLRTTSASMTTSSTPTSISATSAPSPAASAGIDGFVKLHITDTELHETPEIIDPGSEDEEDGEWEYLNADEINQHRAGGGGRNPVGSLASSSAQRNGPVLSSAQIAALPQQQDSPTANAASPGVLDNLIDNYVSAGSGSRNDGTCASRGSCSHYSDCSPASSSSSASGSGSAADPCYCVASSFNGVPEPSQGVNGGFLFLSACIALTTHLGGRSDERLKLGLPPTAATHADMACPCNATYVSHACCREASGLVWEAPEMKLGELVRS